MLNYNGVIQADKFTLTPSSMEDIRTFLNAHLGASFIEIMNIEHYQCECKVKTADGESKLLISLPAKYIQNV